MKYGAIVFLIVMAIQVISAVLSAQAKRKEKERREAQMRQRELQARGVPSSPGQVVLQGQPPVSRAEQIAEQRRAQIEQLRQRREGRGVPGQGTAHPPGRGPVHGPAPGQPRWDRPLPERPIDGGEVEDAQRQRRAHLERELAEQARVADEAEAAERRRQERLRRDAQSRQRAAQRRAAAATTAQPYGGGPPEARQAPSLDAQHPTGTIQRLIGDRATLRTIFVLKELLDPPISLRRTPEGPNP